jgi:PAS domain-containing protein
LPTYQLAHQRSIIGLTARKEGHPLYLVQIFKASPLAGLALCICLATILWCILLTHRQTTRLDKLLPGLLGLIAIYEALRVMRDAGFVPGFKNLDGWVDFVIASLYLIAVMMLKISSTDRIRTKVRLRLVEANEKSVEIGKTLTALAPDLSYLLFDASPLATLATDVDNTVIYWNTAAEDLFGWKRDEVLGQRAPFPMEGPFVDKRGWSMDSVVWTAPIYAANGTRRATLMIAASAATLRSGGFTPVSAESTMALNG